MMPLHQARHGSLLLGLATTVLTAREVGQVVWCDNANSSEKSWLVKDSNGSIDWHRTLHQYALVAGNQV
jgi:hypothetical protein